MKDPQRRLVYVMEHQELRGHRWHWTKLSVLRKHTKTICKMYGLPRVGLIARRKKGEGASYNPGTPGCIWLGEDGLNYCTLAHELAHYITWTRHPKAQDHGPLWAFYYGRLLDQMRVVPLAGFKAICRRYGVKMAAR